MALDKTYRESICAIGAALSILLFVSGAEAANLIGSCTTISQPGDYILSRNIINSTFSNCINITSNNVVFDGSGFIIDGLDSYYTSGVYVHNSKMTITNVTIKNLNVTDWDNGIYYLNATEGKIENNYAGSNYENGILLEVSSDIILTENNARLNRNFGIGLKFSNNNILTSNIAISNGIKDSSTNHGIYLTFSNNNTLNNNYASSNYNGIVLENSNNNTMTNNSANSNEIGGIGLQGSGGNNNLINNSMNNNSINFGAFEFSCAFEYPSSCSNIDTSNTVDGKPIFYIKNAVDTIYDSSTNAGTFYCIRCNNVTIKDLNVTKNTFGIIFILTNNSKIKNISASLNSDGILLYAENNNNTITNNKVSANNLYGIDLGYNNNNNTLINNIVSTNQYGIDLAIGNRNNTIGYNNVSSNDYEGITLGSDNRNNAITYNYVSSNRGRGISLDEVNLNNTITHNEINLNGYGIVLQGGRNLNNTLANNNISSNSKGIFIDNSENNSIYHNNLINNTNQSSDKKWGRGFGDNLWDLDYPGGGNYWSDYNGTDINNDGIGDTPYNISGGMQDRYPFMKMNGWMPQQTATATPGFEISWVIFSVVILFFLKRVRL